MIFAQLVKTQPEEALISKQFTTEALAFQYLFLTAINTDPIIIQPIVSLTSFTMETTI